MLLRVRQTATATVLGAVILCVATVVVTMQLSARATQAAIWLADGIGMAVVSRLDTALSFTQHAMEHFIVVMANWTVIGVGRFAELILLLPLAIIQLITAFGAALSGPAAITLLLIAAMVLVKIFLPRVAEFLNDVLSVPLAVGGMAYAIMQGKRH